MSSTQSPQAGLSDLNTKIGAARHKDLYRSAEDPAAAKAEKKKQARTLGLAFFVVFGVVITGLSFTFNHAWKPGRGAAFGALAQETLPGWQEQKGEGEPKPNAAVAAWKAAPPALTPTRDHSGAAQVAETLDFAFDEADDVDPAGKTPIRIYVDGRLVVTAYFPEPPAEGAEAWVRLPNREPAPARSSFVHAYREAKLLRMLPTRYLLYVGCVLGALGLLVPALLIPFYDFWMKYVTAPLGWFNTRVILGILWVVIFTPLGLVRRIFSGDALRRQSLPEDQSYWIERKKRDPKHFKSGF